MCAITHICIPHMHTLTHVCTHTDACLHTNSRVHVCTHSHSMHMHARVHSHTCTRTCTHVHEHVHCPPLSHVGTCSRDTVPCMSPRTGQRSLPIFPRTLGSKFRVTSPAGPGTASELRKRDVRSLALCGARRGCGPRSPRCCPRCLAGARDPGPQRLRGGPAPLRRLPRPPPAVRGLAQGLGRPGDQHGGVPAPEARPAPEGLRPRQHHGERGPRGCAAGGAGGTAGPVWGVGLRGHGHAAQAGGGRGTSRACCRRWKLASGSSSLAVSGLGSAWRRVLLGRFSAPLCLGCFVDSFLGKAVGS